MTYRLSVGGAAESESLSLKVRRRSRASDYTQFATPREETRKHMHSARRAEHLLSCVSYARVHALTV